MTTTDPLLANMHGYWGGYDHADVAPSVPGLVTYSFGLPDAQLNGVMRARLDPSAVEGALTRVREGFAAAGLPGVWWVGPDSAPDDLSGRLVALGLPEIATLELMSVDLGALPDEAPPAGLDVRPVESPEDVPAWAAVVAELFHLDQAAVPAYLELEAGRPATSRYARVGGWVDGQLVATAALSTDADVAGVYTVATLPAHQRRGYGRAVTLAALLEGRRRGLTVGSLQASTSGHQVYRRLGFTDLGTFRLHGLPD